VSWKTPGGPRTRCTTTIGEGRDAVKLGARAHGWHKAGRLFIMGYENLSIMGNEGYVTLYTKERTE